MLFRQILFLLFLPLFFFLINNSKIYGQCLSVNVEVIVDQHADPCKGPITLDAHYAGYNHLWNTGASTQKITVTKSDTYIVVVDNGSGCTGTDTIKVTFLESPMIDLGPDPAGQCGGCVVLNTGGGSSLDYIWSTGETSESIQYCKTGTNTVSVEATNNLGCSAADSIQINITPGIDVDLGPDVSPCEDEIEITTDLPGYQHLWSTGEATESITVNQSDTFYVDVEDGSGCVGSDTLVVFFFPKPSIDLGPDPDSQCGGCVALDAGVDPALSYLWSDGQTGSKITYCNTGTHEISVTATNEYGCTDKDTVALTILPGFEFSLGKDTTLCSGTVNLNAPSFNGASYLWNNGETTSSIQVNETESYFVRIYNLNGCSTQDTISDTIQVNYANPLTAPEEIYDLSECREKKYSAKPVLGATSYTWSVPDGSTIVSGQGSPTILVSANGNVSGNISVVANNHNESCRSSEQSISVNLKEHPINIPNAFSPNSDGLNDKWVLRNIEVYPNNEVVVLNRWGNEVYRMENYRNDWDGSSLNEGTYFYKIRITFCDEEKIITDYVTIVR